MSQLAPFPSYIIAVDSGCLLLLNSLVRWWIGELLYIWTAKFGPKTINITVWCTTHLQYIYTYWTV